MAIDGIEIGTGGGVRFGVSVCVDMDFICTGGGGGIDGTGGALVGEAGLLLGVRGGLSGSSIVCAAADIIIFGSLSRLRFGCTRLRR